MKKFVVNKGKAGYDFATLADTEERAKDIAWQMYVLDKRKDPENTIYPDEPFSWWKKHADAWGYDKWYTVELDINKADRAKVEE